MKIDPTDAKSVMNILWPGERIVGTVKQRRIGPGGSITVPASVVLTDKRVLIVNRATLGIRHDYEVIPYGAVTSVRLEQGIVSSSVFIRVLGYDTDKGLLKNGKQEGEIDGLRRDDATELSNYINFKLGQRNAPAQEERLPDANIGGYLFCRKCGTKNPVGSNFCSGCGAPLR
jgi:ribosomal protein L40E